MPASRCGAPFDAAATPRPDKGPDPGDPVEPPPFAAVVDVDVVVPPGPDGEVVVVVPVRALIVPVAALTTP